MLEPEPNAVLNAAVFFAEKHWWPVPIPARSKAPVIKRWQDLRLTGDDLPRHFRDGGNIGLLLGEASGGLTDVDLDCAEARRVAARFLPATGMKHGRTGAPLSHWWYVCRGAAPQKFKDPETADDAQATLVELRTSSPTGTLQTLVPPSIHPSGERLTWIGELEPAPVSASDLQEAVRKTAAVTLVARRWGRKGRHDLALPLAGFLVNHRLPQSDAEAFVAAVCEAALDEEHEDRLRAVRDTYARRARGEPVTGTPTLVKCLGRRVVDRLAEWLGLRIHELPAQPEDMATGHGQDGPYRFHNGCTVWDKPQRDGGTLPATLANFIAQITTDIELDDGAETVRQYEILATVQGCQPKRVVLPASSFAPMNWPVEHLGARATVAAGLGAKDRLREAIQRLSRDVKEQRVYAHTGWRHIDGVWCYLHGGGAIRADGLVDGVKVMLGSGLDRFVLPALPQDPTEALQASVSLLKLGPLTVTVPLLGSVYLAPLSEALGSERPDLTLWFHGRSGGLKTELAALAQGHFGNFTRKSLPASFASTPNAVERSLFTFKDALLVVDDYHPPADAREAAAMAQVASRLVRGVGNGIGRNRMRADTTLRPQLPPRALPLATGERLPTGHSNLARMFPVPVQKGAVDLLLLDIAQKRRHLLPQAMAWYVSRLSPQMEALQEELPERFRVLRQQAQQTGVHLREPGQVAHLYLGLEQFLTMVVEAGALTPSEGDDLLGQAWDSLMALAREQAGHLADETPTQRFLALLADGFASRRAYLEAPKGGPPDEAVTWGWNDRDLERPAPGAVLLGIVDEDWLLLYPEATYQFVCTAARAAGQVFPVELRTLLKLLDEERLIAVEPGSARRTPNVAIAGRTRRVIKLRADAVAGLLPLQNGELGEFGEGAAAETEPPES